MTTKDTGLRHFLDLAPLAPEAIRSILNVARNIKDRHKKGEVISALSGRHLAMIFEKNSTRTRISFEVGMRQLGGEAMYLSRNDLQLGRGETIADTAQVISRYVDVIMVRSVYHATLLEMADNSRVPVINGLTNQSHPCQIMADILTFEERFGDIKGHTIAWIGDSNNVCNSVIHAAAKLGFKLNIAAPKKYQPASAIKKWASENGAELTITDDPLTAVKGAKCVMTDTWVSMGDEEPQLKKRVFASYQVTTRLMEMADKDAIFMHCLPAYRGEEVEAEVIDGAASVVFDEAENRMHAQKGVLLWCMGMERDYL